MALIDDLKADLTATRVVIDANAQGLDNLSHLPGIGEDAQAQVLALAEAMNTRRDRLDAVIGAIKELLDHGHPVPPSREVKPEVLARIVRERNEIDSAIGRLRGADDTARSLNLKLDPPREK